MRIKYPNYEKCSVNLTCSVLKYFHANPKHPSLPSADNLLEKGYKNVIIFLLDAMGDSILEHNLTENSFFKQRKIDTISAVFPSTTVAATTSIQSGLFPNEHSWLGWDCYVKELDKNVTVFRNIISNSNIPAAEFDVAKTYFPYTNVIELIQNAGYQAYFATPFEEPYLKGIDDVCNYIEKLCKLDGKKYIYAYCEEPDHTMHATGRYSETSIALLRSLEARIQEMCENLEDTLIFVTADHGQIDTRSAFMEDYPNLLQYLIRMPSIESRALSLFVKEGCQQVFREEFEKTFGDDFMLLDKQTVIEKQIFGHGKAHPEFEDRIGDYVAVAVSDLSIFSSKVTKFVGNHAGMTEDEMTVPVIAIECN